MLIFIYKKALPIFAANFWAITLFLLFSSGCSNNQSKIKFDADYETLSKEIERVIHDQGLNTDLAGNYPDSLLISATLSIVSELDGNSTDLKRDLYNQAIQFAKDRRLDKELADIYVSIFRNNDLDIKGLNVDSLLKEAAVIYQKLNLPSDEMNVYRFLSVLSFEKGYYRDALNYSEMALEVGGRYGLKEQKAIIHSNMALMYTKIADYQRANEYNFNALRIFESLDNQLQIARVNLSVGTVYSLLREREKALEYLYIALNIFEEIDDLRGQSISLTNLASIYRQLGDSDQALKNYMGAVEIDRATNDMNGISSNYNGIGEIYFSQSDFPTAMTYFQQSLEIKKQTGDKSGEADAYIKIAGVKREQGQFDEAIRYIRIGLALYEETGEINKKRNALELLAGIYEQSGNFSTALPLFKEAAFLKDSLFNVEKAVNIALLEEKYLNEKLEYENLTLKYNRDIQNTRIESKKRLMNAYLLALFLTGAAMVLTFIQLRKKNRAFKVLYRKNVDLISKENQIRDMKNKLEKESQEKSSATISDDERKRIFQKLEKAIESEKIFIKPNLTIDKLARKLGTNRTYLSQLINEEYQMKYPDYINKLRVNEAMMLLSNLEKSSRFSIEAIAREAGFNTISNFNSVFKKHTGITPSLFRKEAEEQMDIIEKMSSKLTKLAELAP
jgi:tetratricopeptide (TPR) repeat protein